MPDQTDVENALVAAIGRALYPAGNFAPGASAVGVDARIFRHDPNPAELDADILAGIVNINVAAERNMSADHTRFDTDWHEVEAPRTSLTAISTPTGIVFHGTAGARQCAGIRLGGPTAPAYAVLLTETDGPADAAAKLAFLVPGATAVGATVIVPGVRNPVTRVTGWGTLQRETRRQEDVFRVTLWCPSSDVRDRVGAAVDGALAGQDWLELPQFTSGRLKYRGTTSVETTTKAGSWRRDLLYSIEYPTVELRTAPAIVFGQVFMPDHGVSLTA